MPGVLEQMAVGQKAGRQNYSSVAKYRSEMTQIVSFNLEAAKDWDDFFEKESLKIDFLPLAKFLKIPF